MKAITIKQPWATLIALGEKQFETRSWKTKYRGPLAIHAGKSVDKEACEEMWIKDVLAEYGIKSWKQLPTGVILATTELKECYEVELNFCDNAVCLKDGPTLNGLEVKFGYYDEGRYAWHLTNLEVLTDPIPAKGQLSLWEWDEQEGGEIE